MSKRDSNPHLARALRVLRHRSGRSLKQLTDAVGVSQQIISRWETGQYPPPENRLPLYLEAIGATEEDLARELAIESGTSVIAASPPDNPMQGLEFVEISDETMSPWAEPGERVWFRRGQYPIRMGGCVVEFRDGTKKVRLYERGKDGYYFLRKINPEITETIIHSDIVAVHRVVLRGV